MKKGYDNFRMVDSGLATRRKLGTDYYYMMGMSAGSTATGMPSTTTNNQSSGGGISPDQAVGLANTAGQLLLIAQNRRAQLDAAKSDMEKNIEAACGKQPIGCALDIFNLRPDCKAHKQCRADYVAKVQELEKATAEAEAAAAAANRSMGGDSDNQGLSTGAIIGIVAGGVVVLGAIGYLIYRGRK